MRRITLTTSSVILGVLLAPLIPVHAIAAESGCANGVREALTDLTRFPDIAACAGEWTGHVSNAHVFCAHDWNVCSAYFDMDVAKLNTITFDEAVTVRGCFAFNAAQNNFKCVPCTGEQGVGDEMGGIGVGCHFDEKSSDDSCIQMGRIDVLKPSQLTPTTACQFTPDVTGVLCCRSQCGNGNVDQTGEECDGGECCSPDCQYKPPTTVCRPSRDECDLQETCTGEGGECPHDEKQPSGTPCSDDGNACTTDLCDGVHDACTHAAKPAATVCRPAEGVCDVAETCDGTTATCPPDQFKPSYIECRSAASECDVADFCTGNGPDCMRGEPTAATEYDAVLKVQCKDCAANAIKQLVDCVSSVNGEFRDCRAECPGFPGRCAITRDCLNKCRDTLTREGELCTSKATRRVRMCDGGRQCLKMAKHARRRFRRRCPAPKETCTTVAEQVISCQEGCVQGTVASCYDDCQDQCEGDHLALCICRQACKECCKPGP